MKNLVHLIYSTKGRRPWLHEAVRPDLFRYQAGVFRGIECPALIIGGAVDHVHALFALSKNVALRKVVEEVKKGSSKWMKRELGGNQPDFQWQAGYAAFSVSESQKQSVLRYIENQHEHHKKVQFEDELRSFFTKHDLEFNEKYVWD